MRIANSDGVKWFSFFSFFHFLFLFRNSALKITAITITPDPHLIFISFCRYLMFFFRFLHNDRPALMLILARSCCSKWFWVTYIDEWFSTKAELCFILFFFFPTKRYRWFLREISFYIFFFYYFFLAAVYWHNLQCVVTIKLHMMLFIFTPKIDWIAIESAERCESRHVVGKWFS